MNHFPLPATSAVQTAKLQPRPMQGMLASYFTGLGFSHWGFGCPIPASLDHAHSLSKGGSTVQTAFEVEQYL